MSIINDALKRAQKNMRKDENGTPSPEDSSVQELTRDNQPRPPKTPQKKDGHGTHKKKKVWYQTVSVLVVLFFFITGMLLATLFFLMKRSAAQENPAAELRREYMPASRTRDFKPGELILSGTSFVEDKKVALINGGIYEVGDIVEGYKITSIELRKVELQNLRGDNPITLRARSK